MYGVLILSEYLKKRFDGRVAKVCVDAGFTCPNREDGRKGCLFCTDAGAGEFSGNPLEPISVQFEKGREVMDAKWDNKGYIIYFQNFTNTYARPEILNGKYTEALECAGVAGIAIATRPDCLDEGVLEVLEKFNRETLLWVELGFQTSNERTAGLINRGYGNDLFMESFNKLKRLNIKTVVHLMAGLPGENKEDFLNSVKFINSIKPWGLKIHCTYIQKNSPLYNYSLQNGFHALEMAEYIDMVSDALVMLDKGIVVHRLTGDPDKSKVYEPLWACDKLRVISGIWQSYCIKKDEGQ